MKSKSKKVLVEDKAIERVSELPKGVVAEAVIEKVYNIVAEG